MKFPSRFVIVPLLCLLGVGAGPGQAQPAPQRTAQRVITITNRDELVSFVTRTLKAWESGDCATFIGAFTDDAVFAYPGGRASKAELTALFNDLQTRKSQIRIYVGPFIVAGNEFVMRYQFACTDRQTGKRQAVGTGVRGTLRNSRIAVFKEYWDAHIPDEQMNGKLPLDEGNADLPVPTGFMMPPTRVN